MRQLVNFGLFSDHTMYLKKNPKNRDNRPIPE